jgi:putative oxidoreductase
MDLLFGTFPSISLLIVRVVLGIIFFAHGAQKVFGWFHGPGLRGVIAYFKQALGVPAPLTVLAALTECFGGLAMIVGLLARPAAVGLIIVMLVAISKVHVCQASSPGSP